MEKCNQCDLVFSDLTSLMNHIPFHEQSNSYKCTFTDCYRCYDKFKSLKEHIRRKHSLPTTNANIDNINKDIFMKDIKCKINESVPNTNGSYEITYDYESDASETSNSQDDDFNKNMYLDSEQFFDVLTNDSLHNIGLRLVSKLHSDSDLNRKKVFSLINVINSVYKAVIADIMNKDCVFKN